jgi:alkylhydroperoxidase family enzyme
VPRIPYLPADLSEPAAIVDAIRARRGGTLLNLDRLLLYSPEVASGWNQHLGAIRTRMSLNPRLRELAMLVVAILNRAPYEFVHHAPVFLQAGGTQAQLDALADPDRASVREDLFDETERAALAVAISLTREVRIDDDNFERLRSRLDERELVEYVITVAAYNMVSRILVAFRVEPEH